MSMSSDSGAEVVSILKGALATLADPAKWTQKTFARTAGGRICAVLSEHAVAWDLIAALCKAAGVDGKAMVDIASPVYEAMVELEKSAGESPLAFNDTHGHADVLTLLRTTLERLEVAHAA